MTNPTAETSSKGFTTPKTRLAYVLPFGTEVAALRTTATVTETIQPLYPGRVQFMGTTWRARCRGNVVLTPRATVRVVDRENLTLVVEPLTIDR